MTLNDAKLLGDLTATWISSILVVRRPLYQIIKFKFVSQWGKNAKILVLVTLHFGFLKYTVAQCYRMINLRH